MRLPEFCYQLLDSGWNLEINRSAKSSRSLASRNNPEAEEELLIDLVETLANPNSRSQRREGVE